MSGLGLTQMSSLLASQGAMKAMANLNKTGIKMKGEMRELASRIKTEQSLGMDTAAKEERYAAMQDKASTVMDKIFAMANEMNSNATAGSERIDDNGEKNENDNSVLNADIVTPNIVDTVEISVFGRNLTPFAPKPVSAIPMPRSVQSGAVFQAEA